MGCEVAKNQIPRIEVDTSNQSRRRRPTNWGNLPSRSGGPVELEQALHVTSPVVGQRDRPGFARELAAGGAVRQPIDRSRKALHHVLVAHHDATPVAQQLRRAAVS